MGRGDTEREQAGWGTLFDCQRHDITLHILPAFRVDSAFGTVPLWGERVALAVRCRR